VHGGREKQEKCEEKQARPAPKSSWAELKKLIHF
jgi:hypothetical protein